MSDSDFTGVVSGCSAEDRPALWEMCKAHDPLASPFDIASTLKNVDFGSWAVYRDSNQAIRVAVFMYPNGAVRLVMNPEDMGDSEVKQGFLRLMVGVHKAFKVNGITDLTLVCPNRLKPFVEMLHADGFLSHEVYTAHGIHFTAAGEIERAQ